MPRVASSRLCKRLYPCALSIALLSLGCGTSSSSDDSSGVAGALSAAGAFAAAGASGNAGQASFGGSSGGSAQAVGGVGGAVAGSAGSGISGTAGSGVAGGSEGGALGASGAGGSAGQGATAGADAGGSAGQGGSFGTGAGGSGGMSTALAATPPMGWNSWNTFQCNLNETLIKQIADTIVSSGMQTAGYQYVSLDDCWMDGRDASGNIRANATKFPAGIKALADYVHGKGLKLGIYETPTATTCVGLYGGVSHSVAVGSLGHETADAKSFASWGVDYLKYDKCTGALSGFAVMRDALRATGRPIFYSINPGDGSGCPPNSCSINLPTIANMWRVGFDIGPNWAAVTRLIDENAGLYSFAGPGHWNDPDMMEVGNGLNDAEGRAHFSMWAIMAAPLIAGNDLRSMSAATKATLINSEVIAVDQDAMGAQGRLVASPGTSLQVWSKPLTGTNTRAVALFNRNDTGTASITVQWSALGIPAGAATVRDLWSHTDLGKFSASYTAASVPSHGVVMLKVTSAP